MKRLALICTLFTMATATYIIESDRVMAGGHSNCPAFTAEMVDAAAMAFGLFPGVGASITVGDDPGVPAIFCNIVGSPSTNGFRLEVNSSEPYQAVVSGWHQSEGETLNAELFSLVEQLSLSQMHACRAAILKSFVWNKYCAPALP
jgi:hypothetical protein